MDKKMDDQELISALADGQLQGEAFARGVQAATADARARQAWCAYHVVGEVLHSGRAAVGTPPEAFLARLRERLKDEKPLAAPASPVVQQVQQVERAPRPAANDWVWKLTAGVASVAAVAAVGWNLTAVGTPAAQPQLAAAPTEAAVAAASPASMMRDPRLDQFLAAHRQFGGTSVLQTSSGFLRNATFQATPGR